MTTRRKLLICVLAAPIGILVWFVLVSNVAFHVLTRPDPIEVPAASLPRFFPLLVSWLDDDGSRRCEAFFPYELDRRIDSMPSAAFTAAPSDEWVCERDFEAFNRLGRWPDRPGTGFGARFEITRLPGGSDEVFVSYAIDDEGPNDGWYVIRDAASTPTDTRYWRYFGPTLGVVALSMAAPTSVALHGLASVAWIVWPRRSRK